MQTMSKQKKILIVDDEQPIRTLLEYNLKQAQYETISAADGEEAVQRAESEKPDLILLDLMLPKMDGIDVCKTLRQRGHRHSNYHANSKRGRARQSFRP